MTFYTFEHSVQVEHQLIFIISFVLFLASNLISVLFTSERKGETMSALIDNGNETLHISNGTLSAMRYANINRTSVLFVSISFIVLMIISLAWLIFYYIQRFRYIHAKDILARRLSNAAKKAMDKIPTKTIKPTDLERIFEGGLTECCAVCIDPFKTSDIVRILPCKHLFHKSCVDPWLLENRSCPMCKMDILKFYGLVYAGSQESILNIDVDIDMNQHYWHRTGRHRTSSGGEIEIVHIPIPSPMSRSNRRRNRERTPRVTTTNTHTQTQSSGPLSNSEYLVEPLNNDDNTRVNDETRKHCNSADHTCGDCGASNSNSATSSVQFSLGVENTGNESVTLPHVYARHDVKSCDEKLVNYDKNCSEKY